MCELKRVVRFQVVYGRQWFIHCIYTVRSKKNAHRGIGKRSAQESFQQSHILHGVSDRSDGRLKRNVGDALHIGLNGKGTNLHHVNLDYGKKLMRVGSDGIYEVDGNSYGGHRVVPVWPIIIGIVLFILVIAAAILIGTRRHRKEQTQLRVPTPRTSRRVAATVAIANTNGNGRVITARNHRPKVEQTEV